MAPVKKPKTRSLARGYGMSRKAGKLNRGSNEHVDPSEIQILASIRAIEADIQRAKAVVHYKATDEMNVLKELIDTRRSQAQSIALEILPIYQAHRQQLWVLHGQDHTPTDEHDLGLMLKELKMDLDLLGYDASQGDFAPVDASKEPDHGSQDRA
ncbi:hypothetical protein BC940DRAFT_337775 [Gongronella butleri]|nr:hypothetical protein BC940DRAFT_337775 [Gongronella butleri]